MKQSNFDLGCEVMVFRQPMVGQRNMPLVGNPTSGSAMPTGSSVLLTSMKSASPTGKTGGLFKNLKNSPVTTPTSAYKDSKADGK